MELPPPPKKPKLFIPFLKQKTDKEKPGKIGEKADFIGNVPVSEIAGVFGKRSDIIYGRIRTAKLADIDVKKSSRGMFVSSRKRNLLSTPARMFTPTEKQSRRMLRF